MGRQAAPTQTAKELARMLQPERPDYGYLQKVFQQTRAPRAVKPTKAAKRLPALLTNREVETNGFDRFSDFPPRCLPRTRKARSSDNR